MEQVSLLKNDNKKIYFEVMRIFAIFFVLFNHTGTNGFFLFSICPKGSPQFWVYLFISIFCKFAVPLFFAISGALLLHRENESLKKLWKDKVFKFAVILFIISVLTAVSFMTFAGRDYSLKSWIKQCYSSNISAQLWYLYAYLAFLISLPFLRALVKNLKDKYFYYLIAIVLLFQTVPILEYLLWQQKFTINGNLRPYWLMSNIVIYPCIGYFLEHRLPIQKAKKWLVVIWIFNVLCIIFSACVTNYRCTLQNNFSEGKSPTFYNNFALVNCIAVYITIKYFVNEFKMSDRVNEVILWLGKGTFGVYLFHLIFQNTPLFQKLIAMLKKTVGVHINFMLANWIYVLCLMGFCFIFTAILKKIPVVKKLVGY